MYLVVKGKINFHGLHLVYIRQPRVFVHFSTPPPRTFSSWFRIFSFRVSSIRQGEEAWNPKIYSRIRLHQFIRNAIVPLLFLFSLFFSFFLSLSFPCRFYLYDGQPIIRPCTGSFRASASEASAWLMDINNARHCCADKLQSFSVSGEMRIKDGNWCKHVCPLCNVRIRVPPLVIPLFEHDGA